MRVLDPVGGYAVLSRFHCNLYLSDQKLDMIFHIRKKETNTEESSKDEESERSSRIKSLGQAIFLTPLFYRREAEEQRRLFSREHTSPPD